LPTRRKPPPAAPTHAITTARAGYDAANTLKSGGDPTAGLSVNISLGSSQSSSTSSSSTSTAQGSTLAAGNNLSISASGGDIVATGATLSGQNNLALEAKGNINLLGAANTSTDTSSNRSSSGSIGVGIGASGVSVTASAAQGKGQGTASATTWSETQLAAGDTLSIRSGGDTKLIGAQASGTTVTATIGGNLTLQSQQDTSSASQTQRNASVGASVPVVGAGSGPASLTASLSAQNASATSSTVQQQTGIVAGSGGFQISVAGATTLNGAVIASSADSSTNSISTGSLASTDLSNTASYRASTVGASLNIGSGPGGSLAGGITPGMPQTQGDSQHSTTTSGIAQGSITLTGANAASDGSAATLAGLNRNATDLSGNANPLNANPAIKDILAAQSERQAAFGGASAAAGKTIGDISDAQRSQAQAELDRLRQDPGATPEQLKEAQNAVNSWSEGGSNKIALHAGGGALLAGLGGSAVGGSSSLGTLTGAVGAGASQAAAPITTELGKDIGNTLTDALGIGEGKTKDLIGNLATNAASNLIGAATGGGAGAAAAGNLDRFNRQLHPRELDAIARRAPDLAKQLCGCQNPSQQDIGYANTLLANAAQGAVDNTLGDHTPVDIMKPDQLTALKFFSGMVKEGGTFNDGSGERRLFETRPIAGSDNPLIAYEKQTTTVFQKEVAGNPGAREYYWQFLGINVLPPNPTPEQQALWDQRESERISREGSSWAINNLGPLVVGGALGAIEKVPAIPGGAARPPAVKGSGEVPASVGAGTGVATEGAEVAGRTPLGGAVVEGRVPTHADVAPAFVDSLVKEHISGNSLTRDAANSIFDNTQPAGTVAERPTIVRDEFGNKARNNDVQFRYADSGATIQLEIRTATGQNGFNEQLGVALEAGGKQPDITAMQVPTGTTPAQAQQWLDGFWNSSAAKKYDVVARGGIIVVDNAGNVLVQLQPITRPKPRRTGG
jgi:Hemagglutinin repeat